MILHMVSFRWKDDVTPADVAGLTETLTAMAGQIPELRSYRYGENLRLRPGADYGVAALVDDEAALAAYLDSAVHVAMFDKWLSWMVAERSPVQLPVGDDARL